MIDKRCREHVPDISHPNIIQRDYVSSLIKADICGTGAISAKPRYPPIKPLDIAIPPVNLAMLP